MALEIVQILASGTFGHVAVVRDTETDRLLAAKVLKAVHATNPKLVGRLRDEAAMLGRLHHPNVVALESLAEIDGRPVLLMEWIRGVTLSQLVGRLEGGLAAADVCEVIRLTAGGLFAAWHTPDPATGQPMHVIHRDLKPSNLILSIDGELKLVDFGIAKGSFAGKESETVSMILGAHGYVAPERLDGAEDSPAGDVFALGCIFFELLTSRQIELSLHPGHHAERMARHLMHVRPDGVAPRTVSQLANLIAQMAAYEPADRPDYRQVHHAVSQLMTSEGWRPDLQGLAAAHVVDLLTERPLLAPRQHPAFDDLAFLETGLTRVARNQPRRADDRLRAFFARPAWERQPEQLQRLLAGDPSWSEAPLLEVIDRIRRRERSWWPFGRRAPDPASRARLRLLLEALVARPSAQVRKRAWRLTGHADPEVASLARRLYVDG